MCRTAVVLLAVTQIPSLTAGNVTRSTFFGSSYGAVHNTTYNGINFVNPEDNFPRDGNIPDDGVGNLFTVNFVDTLGNTGSASFTIRDSGFGGGTSIGQSGDGIPLSGSASASVSITLESTSTDVNSLQLDAIGLNRYTLGSNVLSVTLPDDSIYTTETASNIGAIWNVGETLTIGSQTSSGGFRPCGIQVTANLNETKVDPPATLPFPSYNTSTSGGTSVAATATNDILQLVASKSSGVREAFLQIPIQNVSVDANSPSNVGIQFDVRGDTPDGFASMAIRSDANTSTFVRAYQRLFPVSNDWQTVTLYWEDFVFNMKPSGSETGILSIGNQRVDITQMTTIAFGRNYVNNGSRSHVHWSNKADWNLTLKDIRFITTPRADPAPASYTKGVNRTMGKIYNGEGINILTLGDSITDSGMSTPHAYHMSQHLSDLYGTTFNLFNAGVGGATVRTGNIIFPRSISDMRTTVGEPDLVVIMYGANDCKAPAELGFSAADFQAQIETLIDQIRAETNGSADILLLTGVPRVDGAYTASTGEVEAIADGITWAAQSRQTALVDTLSEFLSLETTEWPTYYNDTIHQKQEGHQYMGRIMFEKLLSFDTDKDGINNLLETAMRSAPNDPTDRALTSISYTENAGQKSATFSFPKSRNLSSADYTVFHSLDLVNWTEYTGSLDFTDIGNGTDWVTATVTPTGNQTFFKLEVEAL